MAITLNWPNTNAATATAIRIYVDTVKIPDDTLPVPIATLVGSAVTFSWTPPTDNTVYWFRIAIDRGSDTYLGDNQPYGYFTTTGPGVQQPLRGSWGDVAYFGRVPIAEMLTPAALRTALGVGGGPNDSAITHYYKFYIGGKFIFVPCAALSWAVTWDQIYNLGLMYGVDAFGQEKMAVAPTNLPGVNQKKIITIGAANFLARTFKGSVLPTTTLVNIGVTSNLEGSEYDLTMGRISTTATIPSNVASLWDDNTSVLGGAWQGSITQHFTAATATLRTTVVRGNSASCDAVAGVNTAVQASIWTPVLELQF
jgi:hypothetical protein